MRERLTYGRELDLRARAGPMGKSGTDGRGRDQWRGCCAVKDAALSRASGFNELKGRPSLRSPR